MENSKSLKQCRDVPILKSAHRVFTYLQNLKKIEIVRIRIAGRKLALLSLKSKSYRKFKFQWIIGI